ncbi:hypothetical protein ACFXAZ_10495 [Streptomyces sp. NPDC059477]|uniref:hypothetical protein n=1 Tax=Streptomyces sp. NPDC059477 TaxID=3346847 RepID=UPI0036C161A0
MAGSGSRDHESSRKRDSKKKDSSRRSSPQEGSSRRRSSQEEAAQPDSPQSSAYSNASDYASVYIVQDPQTGEMGTMAAGVEVPEDAPALPEGAVLGAFVPNTADTGRNAEPGTYFAVYQNAADASTAVARYVAATAKKAAKWSWDNREFLGNLLIDLGPQAVQGLAPMIPSAQDTLTQVGAIAGAAPVLRDVYRGVQEYPEHGLFTLNNAALGSRTVGLVANSVSAFQEEGLLQDRLGAGGTWANGLGTGLDLANERHKQGRTAQEPENVGNERGEGTALHTLPDRTRTREREQGATSAVAPTAAHHRPTRVSTAPAASRGGESSGQGSSKKKSREGHHSSKESRYEPKSGSSSGKGRGRS